MIAKVVLATIFCACVTAQKYEASSYTSFSSHHDNHQESSYQHVPTLIKKVAPVLLKAPVATYHHAAPVASYHHAAPVAAYHHTAPVATYHHAAPVASYHHAAPVAIKAAPVLLKAAPVVYHAPAIVKAPVAVHHHHEEEYEHAPAHYAFQYGVKDTHTGDIHNQHEEADGHVVKGAYSLVQPDGITRTVHYTADKNGFNAQVEYSGHASHPEVHHKAVAVKPVIVAKPVAVVAPVYKKVVAVPVHHGYQHHH